MNIFQKKCPCCNNKINKCLFWFSRKVTNGCKYKTDFVCYYCPKCKKQISKGRHVKFELILGGIFISLAWILSKITIDFFQFFPSFPDAVKTIPLILLYSIILMCLYISFIPLKCYDQKNNQNLKEAGGDNKLYDGFFEFDDHIKITPLEKKIKHHMVMLPIYFAVFVIVGFFLLFLFR